MSFINKFFDLIFLNSVDPSSFGPSVIFKIPDNGLTQMLYIANAPIKSSVTTTWVIMAILIIISWLGTRNLKREPKPGSLQNILEAVVESINGLVESTMGSGMRRFVPYIGTLFLYLIISNLMGIIPGRDLFNLYTPTADLNTTFALAFITFINIHFFGIKENGISSYLKGYFEPLPLMFPLNIIGDIADPVSLSFRLFGNMLGGVVIMGLLFSVVTVAIPGFASLYFDVFAGVLQAFIFTMLTMTYISIKME